MVAFWLVASLCLFAFPATAKAQAPRPLLVGSETNFPPYADVDGNGRAVGFSVDLFNAVTRVMDIPIQYRVSDWDVAWNGLLKGELDALPLVARLKVREELLEYTSTHTIGYDCFFVRAGATRIASIDAARARQIIVMRSDAGHHALAARGFEHELIFAETLPDGLRMLAAGKYDAALAPIVQGTGIVREYGLSGIEAGPPLMEYKREFAFAVQKGNTALRDKLEQGLLIVKASGEYQQIYDRWLAVYESPRFPLKYLAWGGGGLAALLLLFSIWNWTLRQSRDRLRESDRRLNEAQQIAHLGSFDWNPVSGKLQWSDEHFRRWGLEPRSVAPTYELFRRGIHPDDVAMVEEILQKALHAGRLYDCEHRVVWRDGSEHCIHGLGEVMFDGAGQAVRMIGTVHDITERRQAEAAVRQLNAELEQRIANRTAQLKAANKELEEFSYSISHDMRTPLRAIDGFSTILQEEYGARLDDNGKRLLKALRDNARRMGTLIDDILRFLGMGSQKIASGAVDIASLASGIFAELQAAEPARRLRLEIGALPPAWGDSEMVRQAMRELLSNAVKYTPADGDALVEIGGAAGEVEDCYYVRDHGVGFDMRYADKLFRVFERVHPTGQYEGTGIGLAIVKRIVDRHDGRVWAEGKVGEGATFHFTLPHRKT